MDLRKPKAPTCGFGTSTIKDTQGTGGLRRALSAMREPLPTPCAECPGRVDSVPGYLGGYSAETYLELVKGPASIACHCSPGFDTGDIGKQRHCTGVAGFRANIGHIAQMDGRTTGAHEATKKIGADLRFFGTEQEFLDHHTPGQKK